jgi:hypothetical protein
MIAALGYVLLAAGIWLIIAIILRLLTPIDPPETWP